MILGKHHEKKRINKKRSPLIEWMLVVTILVILTAIAIPDFLSYQYKAKLIEAKKCFGAYTGFDRKLILLKRTLMLTIGFFFPKGDPRYDYSIDAASVSHSYYIAVAEAKPRKGLTNFAGERDKWTITVNATVSNEVSGCAN